MSAVKGVNKTLIDAGGIANQCAKGTYDARLKVVVDTYEASALANGSTISMGGTLPAGARVQFVELNCDALCAAAGTLSVGDSASAARYISALSVSAAQNKIATLIGGKDYVVGTATGDNQLVITATGGTTFTGTIQLVAFYSND